MSLRPHSAVAPPRVLHVLAPGDIGGLERVVEALASGRTRRGAPTSAVVIVDRGRSDHPVAASLRRSNVPVDLLEIAPRRYLRERRAIADLLQRQRPDIVHTHGYRTDVLASAVARGMDIPTVTTVHGFTGGGWKNRLYEHLQTRAFRRIGAVVAVARPMRERLERAGVPAGKIHVVTNGWGGGDPLPREAARRGLGLDETGFHLGWVGRISPEKGLDVLLAALPYLSDLPLVVSIIGGSSEAEDTHPAPGSESSAVQIRWHGQVADAARLFRAFDVFVLSSRTEGTPIALFEAIAAGVPVIATRVGGVPDIVSDREAILVPPEDPRRLATAIRSVHEDRPAAEHRASEARARLGREFALDPWLDRYEAIYRSLLSPVD